MVDTAHCTTDKEEDDLSPHSLEIFLLEVANMISPCNERDFGIKQGKRKRQWKRVQRHMTVLSLWGIQ